MNRTLLVLLAAAAVSSAHHDDGHAKGKPVVKPLSAVDIVETVDGKKSKATTVEVTLGPGEASMPHRHPGPVFGYVLEGEYEWAIDDKPAKILKVGDTFYEPAGCLHRVSKNRSMKHKARVLAVVLHPRDAKDLVIPEPAKKD